MQSDVTATILMTDNSTKRTGDLKRTEGLPTSSPLEREYGNEQLKNSSEQKLNTAALSSIGFQS